MEEKFDTKLEKLSADIADIRIMLQQLNGLTHRVETMEDALESLYGKDGAITEIIKFQASCPRDKVVSMQKQLVGLTLAVLTGLFGLIGGLFTGLFSGGK